MSPSRSRQTGPLLTQVSLFDRTTPLLSGSRFRSYDGRGGDRYEGGRSEKGVTQICERHGGAHPGKEEIDARRKSDVPRFTAVAKSKNRFGAERRTERFTKAGELQSCADATTDANNPIGRVHDQSIANTQ